MDPWSSPTIVPSHPADKLSDLSRDVGTADSFGSGDQPPEQLEALPLPTDHRVGLNHYESVGPVAPSAAKKHPEQPIHRSQYGPRDFCLKTDNCWRRAKFSTINSSRDRNNARAQPNVRVRAKRIILRKLTADDRWANQTPSPIALNAHKISHDGIMSNDRNSLCLGSNRSSPSRFKACRRASASPLPGVRST